MKDCEISGAEKDTCGFGIKRGSERRMRIRAGLNRDQNSAKILELALDQTSVQV